MNGRLYGFLRPTRLREDNRACCRQCGVLQQCSAGDAYPVLRHGRLSVCSIGNAGLFEYQRLPRKQPDAGSQYWLALRNIVDNDILRFERQAQAKLRRLFREVENNDQRSGIAGAFVGVEVRVVPGDIVIRAKDERGLRFPSTNEVAIKREN